MLCEGQGIQLLPLLLEILVWLTHAVQARRVPHATSNPLASSSLSRKRVFRFWFDPNEGCPIPCNVRFDELGCTDNRNPALTKIINIVSSDTL